MTHPSHAIVTSLPLAYAPTLCDRRVAYPLLTPPPPSTGKPPARPGKDKKLAPAPPPSNTLSLSTSMSSDSVSGAGPGGDSSLLYPAAPSGGEGKGLRKRPSYQMVRPRYSFFRSMPFPDPAEPYSSFLFCICAALFFICVALFFFLFLICVAPVFIFGTRDWR